MTHYLVLSLAMACIATFDLWQGRPVDSPLLLSGIFLICHEIKKNRHNE